MKGSRPASVRSSATVVWAESVTRGHPEAQVATRGVAHRDDSPQIQVVQWGQVPHGVDGQADIQQGVRVPTPWVVDPAQSKVYVYKSTTDVRIFTQGDQVEGDDVLPGLRLSVTDQFNRAGEPE